MSARDVLRELGALVGHGDPEAFADWVLAPPCDHSGPWDPDPSETCEAPCGQQHDWCRACGKPMRPPCPIQSDDIPDFPPKPDDAAVRALREAAPVWVPGDPVYPNESDRRWCASCLTGWIGGPEQCPECGRTAVEGCASCGARDGCPACIVPPEETP